MTRFLRDTSTVASVVWKLPDASVLAKEHGGECAISTPVWHELQYGTRRLPRGKRRQTPEAFLDVVVKATLPILPYDERAAEWHGEERARLERAGKTPPFVDAQIAAIAVTCGLPLVTANPVDFKPFKGSYGLELDFGKVWLTDDSQGASATRPLELRASLQSDPRK